MFNAAQSRSATGDAVTTCKANGREPSEIMVGSEWALDFTRDGLYFTAETEARQARRGRWARGFCS
jgi:endonuclease YncB( thermonuclease family)